MDISELLAKGENEGASFRIWEGRLEIKEIDRLDKGLRALLKNNEQEIIRHMCDQNPDLTIPDFPKPYLAGKGELVIPIGCHPRYRYWQRGCKSTWQPVNDSLSLKEILLELGASEEVMKRYLYSPGDATDQKG